MVLEPVKRQGEFEPIAMTRSEAGEIYRRFLACWASDLLRLRRGGLDRPGVVVGRIEAAGRAA